MNLTDEKISFTENEYDYLQHVSFYLKMDIETIVRWAVRGLMDGKTPENIPTCADLDYLNEHPYATWTTEYHR